MTTSNSKKRGRPLGSKNKPKKVPRAVKGKSFKQFNPEQRAFAKIVELEKIRNNLHNLIDNLEHKIVQYQAVISYLEHKLENK
jgi:hypothetical protein